MKRSVFFLLLILIFSSCLFNQPQADEKLQEAALLIDTNLDSALVLLNNMLDEYPLMWEKNQALFGLLYFQACDKNNLVLPSVDFINNSINYYEYKKDRYNLAHCYFYKARSYVYEKNFSEATVLLIKAKEYAQNGGDYSLLGKVHYDIATICFWLGENEKGEQEFIRSIDYFTKTEEVENVATAQWGLGNHLRQSMRYDDAAKYYRQALDTSNDSVLINAILVDLGYNYSFMEKYDSTLYYIYESFKYPNSNSDQSRVYSIMADIYFTLEKDDSAAYYAHKALKYSSDFYTKRTIYRILANTSYLFEDEVNNTAYYVSKYQDYTDSLTMSKLHTRVGEHEKSYIADKEIQQVKKYSGLLVAGIVLLIIGSSIGLVSLYKRNKEKQQAVNTYKTKLDISKLANIRQEMAREIEVAKDKVREKKIGMTLDERIALDKKVLTKLLSLDNEDEFINKMNGKLNNLPAKLKATYPDISYKEMIWCCLFMLGVTKEDMLVILDYTSNSLYKLKQRLREKWGFKKAKDLEEMLNDKFVQ